MQTRITFMWGRAAEFEPSQEALAMATREITTQIPASIRAAWADGAVTPINADGRGRVDLQTLRSYAAARLVELNAARPASAPPITLSGGTGSPPSGMMFVYEGGELIAVNLFPLNAGAGPWQPPAPPGETSPNVLIRIAWNLP